MEQQTFDELLNSPGPSRGRGRGRGNRGGFGGGSHSGGGIPGNLRGGRGGPSGSRGGPNGRGAAARGGFPAHRGGASFKTDYSNMAFDYSKIEKQRYVNMAGYNVSPFGPNENKSTNNSSPSGTPRGRESWTPRGSGPGRGGFNRQGGGPNSNTQSPGNSGSVTPVKGLGYKNLNGKGKAPDPHQTMIRPSTVGKGIRGGKSVTWGGGKAPLFVKAGELFKDGEVGIPFTDQEIEQHIAEIPGPEPVVAITAHDLVRQISAPLRSPSVPVQPIPQFEYTTFEQAALNLDVTQDVEIIQWGGKELPPSVPVVTAVSAAKPAPPPREPSPEVDAVDLFFVDTAPTITETHTAKVIYQTSSTAPLGTHVDPSSSEDEKIVFAPRTYRNPEPIVVETTSKIPSSSIKPPNSTNRKEEPILTSVFVNPKSLSRAEKKSAKKQKKKARGKNKGKKGGQGRVELMLGNESDIEWGSDGPPKGFEERNLMSSEEEDDEENSMAILRDYMEGTKLGREASEEEVGSDEKSESALDERILQEMRKKKDVKGKGKAIDSDARAVEEKLEQNNGLTEDIITDDMDGSQWESTSDASGTTSSSSSSSDLGNHDDFDELMEFDTEEEEAFFTGSKSNWKNKNKNNDTDWFIQSMEAALDGGAMDVSTRTERNRIFKAIEEGDFGDDWPTAPISSGKKKKKMMKGVPVELQAQWEKDRQKKAFKKEQRQLERLLAELDPNMAKEARAARNIKKGKGKGKNKIRDAQMAHRLPGSAQEVADLFDVSSSEDDDEDDSDMPPIPHARKKMNRMRNLLLPKSLEDFETEIRVFLDDHTKQTYSCPPMDKEARAKIHILAECFGLKSKSKGSGKSRFTVLLKTKHSGQNINERKVARLLSASNLSGGQFYKTLHSKSRDGKAKGPPGDRGSSTRAKEGDLVGEGAAKIGEENVGHKLLSKMGWAEGDKIGRTGGLEAPVIAIVKYTKRGLGH